MNKKLYRFTTEGFENLKRELSNLTSERTQVVTNLSNAREQGDLSENAGYHATKDELSQIDSRIRELKYLLRVGKTIENKTSDIVSFGSSVTVEVNSSKLKFQIVEEMEAEPSKGKISTSSPIGKALMGKKAGDINPLPNPRGRKLGVTSSQKIFLS